MSVYNTDTPLDDIVVGSTSVVKRNGCFRQFAVLLPYLHRSCFSGALLWSHDVNIFFNQYYNGYNKCSIRHLSSRYTLHEIVCKITVNIFSFETLTGLI